MPKKPDYHFCKAQLIKLQWRKTKGHTRVKFHFCSSLLGLAPSTSHIPAKEKSRLLQKYMVILVKRFMQRSISEEINTIGLRQKVVLMSLDSSNWWRYTEPKGNYDPEDGVRAVSQQWPRSPAGDTWCVWLTWEPCLGLRFHLMFFRWLKLY